MQCPFEHPELAQSKTPEQSRRRCSSGPSGRSRCDRGRKTTAAARCIASGFSLRRPSAVEKVGVDIAIVAERPIVEAITANGEIVYDETRMAHFSSRVPGDGLARAEASRRPRERRATCSR